MARPVFMLIEEPFTGENVARSVREEALTDIIAELQRALVRLSECLPGPQLDSTFQVRAAIRLMT